MKEIITTIKIDDNGNVIGTSTETKVIEEKTEEKEHLYSPYVKVFDWDSPLYMKDHEFNMKVLRYQERFANDKLKAKGHLFLNEVYDMLGLSRTKIGQLDGWVYDADNPDRQNYVEFELYPLHNCESCIIIDFNVDGNILDLI